MKRALIGMFISVFALGDCAAGEFPSVDPATQQARDSDRLRILQRELQDEMEAFARVQAEIEAANRNPAEKNASTNARLEEQLAVHRRNIAALNQEIQQTGTQARQAQARVATRTTNPARERVNPVAASPRGEAPPWDTYGRVNKSQIDVYQGSLSGREEPYILKAR